MIKGEANFKGFFTIVNMETASSSETLVPIGEFTGDKNFQNKCKTHRLQKLH
jgi:hypothetical protein